MRVVCGVVSNGGVGPFFWEGKPGSNLKQWQRTSEKHRRLLFKEMVASIAKFSGKLIGVHIYPSSGPYSREPLRCAPEDIDALLEQRDERPGRVYQSPMRLIAHFKSSTKAKGFESGCKAMLRRK
tara:strand:+ start:254 stop:628 length:375 start_codon:yes stop_codon:yes gene_type:complete